MSDQYHCTRAFTSCLNTSYPVWAVVRNDGRVRFSVPVNTVVVTCLFVAGQASSKLSDCFFVFFVWPFHTPPMMTPVPCPADPTISTYFILIIA